MIRVPPVLLVTAAAALALAATQPLGAQPPSAGSLAGTYSCASGVLTDVAFGAMAGPAGRSSVSISDAVYRRSVSAYPDLTFILRPNGTYANVTLGEVYASNPQWNGSAQLRGGQLRLVTNAGNLLHAFESARAGDGTQLLVEVHEPEKRHQAQCCRRISQPPAAAPAVAPASATTSPARARRASRP